MVTTVSGGAALFEALSAIYQQAQRVSAEIIVPYDNWSDEIERLSEQYPKVRFVEVENESVACLPESTPRQHDLYDRRRATGLLNSRGAIIAITEDNARVASDWCEQILRLHSELSSYAVIGGAVENGVDRILNWTWYYCDFGRYGRPFISGERDYVSDVNVSYKRDALFAICHLWADSYHETTVHWAMVRNGTKLYLDDRLVVFQHRPALPMIKALSERIEWGRVFAETRTLEIDNSRRVLFALGATVLPILLSIRAIGDMIRQRRRFFCITAVSPVVLLLSLSWAVGEFFGYVVGARGPGFSSTNKHLGNTRPISS